MQSHYTKLLRAMLTASLMLVAMAGTAVAGPLEDAGAASERHDYRTALRLFRLLAEQGNAIAQSALGYMHETGEGVPQDYSEAAKWYRLAGEQGDALAQTRLGFMYEMGKGGSQNFAEAAKWLRLAAEQGRVAAQNSLGGLYVSGRGVAKGLCRRVHVVQLVSRSGRPRFGHTARPRREAHDSRTDRGSAEIGARVEAEAVVPCSSGKVSGVLGADAA